jgi:hypothetical protein
MKRLKTFAVDCTERIERGSNRSTYGNGYQKVQRQIDEWLQEQNIQGKLEIDYKETVYDFGMQGKQYKLIASVIYDDGKAAKGR